MSQTTSPVPYDEVIVPKKNVSRLVLFAIGMAMTAALYVLAFVRLPGPEDLRSRYMKQINDTTVELRHITDAVTAVNFDYRGFDTLGEEFILFVSVMGAVVLLRQQEGDKPSNVPDAVEKSRAVGPSDLLRIWTQGLTGPTVLFGIYIVIHGQLTPGGGFQGGVILATAPLLIYLADDFEVFKRITSHRWVETAEAVGAAGYAMIGASALMFGKHFLTNVIPLGPSAGQINLLSGGTAPAISFSVGLEVTAGFTLLLYAFLQETLSAQEGG